MKITKLLKKPHPFIFNKSSVFIVGGITFLIVFIFAPFGFDNLPKIQLFGFSVIFGLMAALCVWGVIKALHYFFSLHFQEENWTIGKEIGLVFSVLIVIVFVVFLLFIALNSSQNRVDLFQMVVIRTIAISFFPILIMILYEQYHHQKQKWKEAQLLNKNLQEKQNQLKTDFDNQLQTQNELQIKVEEIENKLLPKKIVLEAENGKIALQLESKQILYLQSEGNYIEVFYKSENKIQKELIRNSLKKIEEILPKEDFFRCHKSYIVNLTKIEKVEGNARNFELILQNKDTKIPVSRSKSQELSELIKANS